MNARVQGSLAGMKGLRRGIPGGTQAGKIVSTGGGFRKNPRKQGIRLG